MRCCAKPVDVQIYGPCQVRRIFKRPHTHSWPDCRMKHHVLTRGLGLGHVFVHTIIITDVAHNGLRIPEEIASVLDIPENVKVTLIYGYDWNNYEYSYYTCKHERICFRAGWPQFAAQHRRWLCCAGALPQKQ